MSKRSIFTTITPLPAGITRATVMETLRSHVEMIDLNPLVEERHPIKPPPNATPEEYHCVWYSLTDRVQYLPGGLMSGKVQYNACFHDLDMGLQTHVYAPMGLNIRGKWTLGGSLPGEPIAPVEIGLGVPLQGLFLREDVDMSCNFMMTSFVKKTLKKAHSQLVGRLVIKSQIVDASKTNLQLHQQGLARQESEYQGSTDSPRPSDYDSQGFRHSANSDSQHNSHGSHGLHGSVSHSDSLRKDAYNAGERFEADNSLRPKPLSIRSSSASYDGSTTGSQSGQRDSSASANQPVSWQTLNTGRSSPAIRQDNNAPPPQRAPAPSSYNPAAYAVLTQQKPDPRSTPAQSRYVPPANHGAVELE